MPIIDHDIAERRIKSFIKDINNQQGNNTIKAKETELFRFFKKDSVIIEKTKNGVGKYFGKYKNSKKDGYGVYINEDGEEWLGKWCEGKKNGDFIGKAKNGNIYHYSYNDNGKIVSKKTLYGNPNFNSGNQLRGNQIANQETSQQAQVITIQRPRQSSATSQRNIARTTETSVATGRGNNTVVANSINEIFPPRYINQPQIQRPIFITSDNHQTATISIPRLLLLQQEQRGLLPQNNSGNSSRNQQSLAKSTIEIKKENEDLENEVADLFIKATNKGMGLTKNTAININNLKIIEFIRKRRNKGKEIDIIANILKISTCKNGGKEIFKCLKELEIISPYKFGEDDIKKLFYILHKDNQTRYSETFSEFFKTYCQEQSYRNGYFVLNKILELNDKILKSLASEDVIKSLYAFRPVASGYVDYLIGEKQALKDIFVKNIGKICLFKENQPYFIEDKESLGNITLDLRKIINDPEIKLGLRYPKTTLFDNYPDKNQYLINLLLFFNKNPIDFTIDFTEYQYNKEFLIFLVCHNINKEIMPNAYIENNLSKFARQYTKHLTPSIELFKQIQEAIATIKSSINQNDLKEITELENQCKYHGNSGKEIFDFLGKKSGILGKFSQDLYDQEKLVKIYEILEAEKDKIIYRLRNNTKEGLVKYCLGLFSVMTGLTTSSTKQNDSTEITELEIRCKYNGNAGKNIFDFLGKKLAIPLEKSVNNDDKANRLKVYQALTANKDDIINLLKDTKEEGLETFCLELFNISAGSAKDGCVANVGAQINNFVTNKAIENAPESIKILNITLKEILHNFNREYQISDILGDKANSDIYDKKVYKDFLINEELLVERINEKLDNKACTEILRNKFYYCFGEGEITLENQKDLALATILIELRERGIDLTRNYSKFNKLENLYNEKMTKEKELKVLAEAETAPKNNPTNSSCTAIHTTTTSEKSNSANNSMY